MRKIMIGASIILAGFQVWPLMFGHTVGVTPGAASAVAPAAKLMPAVAMMSSAPKTVPASASVPAPKSCYRQYQAKFGACAPGDAACHVKAADQWDLCEATGFWPQ